MDPKLTLSAIREKEPFIRGVIHELIDSWIDRGEVEFMKDFAEPLPMIVIGELRRYITGWLNYYRISHTYSQVEQLAEHCY